MPFKFNPLTGNLDLVSDTSGYVLKSGDTMAGNLLFPTDNSIQFGVTTNFIRNDSGEGKFWIATSADNAVLKFTYGGASGYMQIDQFGVGEIARISSGNLDWKGGNIGTKTAGHGFEVKEGSNARMGTATLAAGTATVSTNVVTANSRVFLTLQSLGTVATPKAIAVTARTAGASFTITSADNTDTSVVAWLIMEPS